MQSIPKYLYKKPHDICAKKPWVLELLEQRAMSDMDADHRLSNFLIPSKILFFLHLWNLLSEELHRIIMCDIFLIFMYTNSLKKKNNNHFHYY